MNQFEKIEFKITKGKSEKEVYNIYKDGPVSIGRAAGNLIRFDDDTEEYGVSRNHCEVEIKFPNITIYDKSTNGTFIKSESGSKGNKLKPETITALKDDNTYIGIGSVCELQMTVVSPVCDICKTRLTRVDIAARVAMKNKGDIETRVDIENICKKCEKYTDKVAENLLERGRK